MYPDLVKYDGLVRDTGIVVEQHNHSFGKVMG
jgi:hypothetical protein